MNKYVRKLLGVMFQRQQAQQVVQAPLHHSPTSPEEWHAHWQAKGFPWRTEPEIDEKRQEELSKCRAIVPDIEKGIYPFKGMKLSRADVEWLLATHENGRGPVDWSDVQQRKRRGLDLRGADLRQVNLGSLPLARLYGGLLWQEWKIATEEQRATAGIHLEGAILREAHLEQAILRKAHLEGAILRYAFLEQARLLQAHLERANCFRVHFEGANCRESHFEAANLELVHFDHETSLQNIILGDEKLRFASLVDVHWEGVNLAVVKWSPVDTLGDEYEALQKMRDGKRKSRRMILADYGRAVRANRQLATALQGQGLNEDAARFTYRAQILQRKLLWKQRNLWKWLGSAILALLAGYGYRMWRILVAYLVIVLLCAVAYFVLGMYYEPHLSFLEAVLTSATAFHGRVFSEPFLRPGEPQLWVTAFEAVAGLVIEGVFIAMLTQKFFGK